MQVILTPTAVPDLFGPGLNGFTDTPPDKTQLSAEWHNSVQMELVNAILDQGYALDALNFGQLSTALNGWNFSGSPTVLSGATLFVASGGSLVVQSGGEADFLAGSIVNFDGIVNFNGTTLFTSPTTFGDNLADTMTFIGQTWFQSPVTFFDSADFRGAAIVSGALGGSLSSDPTAELQWNGSAFFNGRLNLLAAVSLAQNDLSSSSGRLRWHDGAGTKFVHYTTNGNFKGLGVADGIPAAASITLDTSTSVAPQVASDVDVHASFWVQRAVAGDIIVSLEAVGVGQIGTSGTIRVPFVGGTEYLPLTFSRVRVGANTTPRVYRLVVNGNGENVTVRAARVVAEPRSK